MDMEYEKPTRTSRRPLIVVTFIFVIVVVIVGAVVWKVTRDAYESDDSSINGDNSNIKDKDKPDVKSTTERPLTEEELKKQPWKTLLLPRNVLPVHYDITIYPNFYDDSATFYGNETIELSITSPTKFILIHVHTYFMNVTNAKVMDNETGNDITIHRTFSYKLNQFFVIETKEEMTKGIKVALQFEGAMNKSITGLYKSSYYDPVKQETRYMSTSKFEPTFARRAFPCLDEPNMKAEYTITLQHRPEYIALSNMPADDGKSTAVKGADDLVATGFQRSVKMSTYLVCFIVCDFKHKNTTSDKGVPIRVFTTPNTIDQGDYALKVAKHTLDKYEEVFKIDYPLPKLDLIGIPNFVSGAMEHWGLITFRESLFLFDETKTPLSSKERVNSVISHEMAHQWFGNIVTMDWWNDLWLNEGFASYMEYLGVSSLETTWEYNDEFLIYDTLKVMPADALNSTHPIIVTVNHPDEITSVFDAISYSKGAAVIRMLETIMGSEKFFQGVSDYLNKFKWANAKTDDLWDSLSEAEPDIKVKKIMDTWTIQDGYPYVNISLTTSANGITTVKASQRRFLFDSSAAYNPDASPYGYKWYIPLDFIITNETTGLENMDMVEDIEFKGDFGLSKKETNWIKFNKNKIGFYRVLYPEAMWKRFADYLNTIPPNEWKLATGDRADLLADAFSFAESGLISYEIPLSLASYLNKEEKYVPWSVAVNYGMFYITNMLVTSADYELWKRFLVEQVEPAVKRLNFTDEGSHVERRLRSLVMNQACKYEEKTTLTAIHKMFRDWLDNNGNSPSVNIRAAVYVCGMTQFGSDKDWDDVWQKYQNESSPQEKELLVYALTKTRKPYLIRKLLERARAADGIKTQDFFTVVSNLASNEYGNSIVWSWAREHYGEFENRFTVNDRSFGRMVYSIVRKYNRPIQLEEVKELFRKYPNEGASARNRKMAIESIEKNINWMNTARKDIVSWLNKKYPNS